MAETGIDLKQRAAFKHWTPVTIRYSDEDSNGHVNNVAIAAYFEAGRTMLIHNFWDREKYPHIAYALVRVAIDYLREFRYPGTVEVGGRIVRVGGKSFTSGYGLFLGESCLATCESVNVFFDTQKRAAVAPPDDIRQRLLAALESGGV